MITRRLTSEPPLGWAVPDASAAIESSATGGPRAGARAAQHQLPARGSPAKLAS
jgi:hypothetical protein